MYGSLSLKFDITFCVFVAGRGQCFPNIDIFFCVCAEFAIFPKISNFAPFRFGSIAYIFSKIVKHHCHDCINFYAIA